MNLHPGKRFCPGCLAETVSDRCARAGCTWSRIDQRKMKSHLRHHTLLMGRYYIGQSLGQGGFGVTYKALDLGNPTPRIVAVKEYLPLGLCDRSEDGGTVQPCQGDLEVTYWRGVERFLTEGKNLMTFSLPSYGPPLPGSEIARHANIVGCAEVFEANGTAYLIMDYIGGPTLADYLKDKGGVISYSKAIEILVPAMDGLRAMHRKKLVHRDISPSNIMFSPLATSGRADAFQVKLVDFGAARFAIGEQSQNLSVIVKPGYAPVEQYYSGGHQGAWTDVYAMAAVLYRCITGETPPPALNRHVKDDCIAAGVLYREVHPEGPLPPAVEQVLVKGLAVKADQRYQTIEDFQQALLTASGKITDRKVKTERRPPENQIDEPKVVKPNVVDGGQRSRTAWVISGALLLVCTTAAGMLSWRHMASEANMRRSTVLYGENRFAEAAPPLASACADGKWEACKDLGNMYWEGKGVTQDTTRALSLFNTACDAGYSPACNNLAIMYTEGKVVRQDLSRAADLYTAACNRDLDVSCANLGDLYLTNQAIRNEARAGVFYGIACDRNYARACVSLAGMYNGDSNFQKDPPRAATLYEKACGLGDQNGCLSLGLMVEKGWEGMPPDPRRAASLYKAVCDQDNHLGCNDLGTMYFSGYGVPKDQEHANQLYRNACDRGTAVACRNLGLSYELGSAVVQDYDRAIELYTKSCDAGYAKGCSSEGTLYWNGPEQIRNKETALVWLKKGCNLGDTAGCDLVQKIDSAEGFNNLFAKH